MNNAHSSDYFKLRIVYKDIGFFHGYYIQKRSTLIRIPNWIGKLLV